MEDFKLCPACGLQLEELSQDLFDASTDTHQEIFTGYACRCGCEDLDEAMHEEAKWL